MSIVPAVIWVFHIVISVWGIPQWLVCLNDISTFFLPLPIIVLPHLRRGRWRFLRFAICVLGAIAERKPVEPTHRFRLSLLLLLFLWKCRKFFALIPFNCNHSCLPGRQLLLYALFPITPLTFHIIWFRAFFHCSAFNWRNNSSKFILPNTLIVYRCNNLISMWIHL